MFRLRRWFFSGIRTFMVFIIFVLLIDSALSLFLHTRLYNHVLINQNREYQPLKIYIVGESTSQGAPFHTKFSLADIICYQFDNSINGRPLQIVNLGRGGCNLEFQYGRFVQELLLHPPQDGVVLIYAGINDPCPDNELDRHFSVWCAMQRMVLVSRSIDFLMQKGLLLNIFGKYYTAQKYEYRLRQIVTCAKQNNLKVIISTLVGNYADFPPDQLPVSVSAKRRQVQPGDYFQRGRAYQQKNDFALARENYYQAVASGVSRRPTRRQNEIIRDVARQESVFLAEPLQLFEAFSPQGLLGDTLFIDAHHPNIQGYTILAQAFSKALVRAYHCPIKYDKVSALKVRTHFNIADADLGYVYYGSAYWHCVIASSYKDSQARDMLLDKAKKYLEKADKLLSASVPSKDGINIQYRDGFIAAYVLIAAIRQDKQALAYWLQYGGFNQERMFNENKQYNAWVIDNIRKNHISFH